MTCCASIRLMTRGYCRFLATAITRNLMISLATFIVLYTLLMMSLFDSRGDERTLFHGER